MHRAIMESLQELRASLNALRKIKGKTAEDEKNIKDIMSKIDSHPDKIAEMTKKKQERVEQKKRINQRLATLICTQ
jgi:uncharacterized coiled-coil DUF342 family protein